MKLSIIIPIYNEEESIKVLYQELKQVLNNLSFEYEIIAIDDGSTDNSNQIIREIAQQDYNFKTISFKRNFGQTAAMSAGIDASQGDIIIPMDADLQNNPADIPEFLEKVDQGFDVVSGWRVNRRDKLWTRKIPSWIANYLISLITKVKLHDYGCTMKAYKKEVIKDIRLYGEMHRFMPAYTAWHGAKVTEIPVNHRPRKYGQTKYSVFKTFRVILDLLTVKFLIDYSTKPMHFFGKIGYWLSFFGLISGCWALYLKIFKDIYFITTPLPLLTVFLILVGLQFILMGLLAEILTRTHYESQNKPIYSIKEKINF
ncbi:MAG: glycosyltransferase family 2 protein [Patescibacteria group bacterium]|nr:glycosyltransferase family 2 protein [Patescibacteria group bacterium]MBU2472882.1 glycosyltransferase family 2 protein [Patescibacteria group bacterium]